MHAQTTERRAYYVFIAILVQHMIDEALLHLSNMVTDPAVHVEHLRKFFTLVDLFQKMKHSERPLIVIPPRFILQLEAWEFLFNLF